MPRIARYREQDKCEYETAEVDLPWRICCRKRTLWIKVLSISLGFWVCATAILFFIWILQDLSKGSKEIIPGGSVYLSFVLGMTVNARRDSIGWKAKRTVKGGGFSSPPIRNIYCLYWEKSIINRHKIFSIAHVKRSGPSLCFVGFIQSLTHSCK